AFVGASLAWRGRRVGSAVAVLGIAVTLVLATPMAAGLLLASLEGVAPAALAVSPGAIIILGAEARNGPDGPDVGPLTLERLRRPDGRLTDWLPRADCLAMSWLALREWGGLAAMKLGL